MVPNFIKALFRGQQAAALQVADNSRRHWITNPWHAVSISATANACSCARKLSRARFLSKDAPALPLVGCSSRKCDCHYRHHQDRRNELRRESDVGASSRHWMRQERRSSAGRRVND